MIWKLIDGFVDRMFSHKIWIDKDPNIDIVISKKKSELTKKLFEDHGLTNNWILVLI